VVAKSRKLGLLARALCGKLLPGLSPGCARRLVVRLASSARWRAPSDPVFVALLDAQSRIAIPSQLLDRLVQGTATDLEPRVAAYATFADLYRYC
jgi:phytoene/squalene synthetase